MWFGKRTDKDFRAEIKSHVRLEADRLIAEGVPASEAEAAAKRAFGNIATARERFYESRRVLWLDQLKQDLSYGLRSFVKTPGFTVAVALTIALGVGANTAVFSLMDAVLFSSLPVQNPKQLVFLEMAGSEGPSGPPAYPCFQRLRDETDVFTGAAAFASDELRIEINGKAEQVMGQVASGKYFHVLGLKPALGRLMNADDEKLNPPVVVISNRYWRRRFGSDPAVIGKSISYRNQSFTIIGVTPAHFLGMQPGSALDVTFPISVEQQLQADRTAIWLSGIVARLKPGVSVAKAQAESEGIFQVFMHSSRLPSDIAAKYWARLEAVPAAHGSDVLRRRFSKPLYALLGVALLVLLLAVANTANLLLARAFTRRGEFAVRLATGAGRWRIMRQVLTETLLLFGLGAIPGLALAAWGVGLIETLFRAGRRPLVVDASPNWHVAAFCLLATLAAALLSGVLPSWRAIQIDPEQALKEGGPRNSESRNSAIFTQSLVAFQVGLSLVLLVGALAFVRTLVNLRNVDPGFRNEDVLTLSIQVPVELATLSKSIPIWNQVLDSVRALPGVRTAALATYTPLSGRDRGGMVMIRGYQPPAFEDGIIHINHVSSGYFESLGIQLLRGRRLNDRDTASSRKVAVINESAAKQYFQKRNPIGESLDFVRNGNHNIYEIVGVVRNTKHMSLREASPRFAFLPLRQAQDEEQRVTLVVAPVQASGVMALLQAVRSEISKVDSEILISDVITMRQQLDSTLLTERLLSGLSSIFGILALTLASVGLYGVLTHQVGRQRQSIGIRMALGATPLSIGITVVSRSAMMLSTGLLCGLPFAIWATRATANMLWGVKASNPYTYIVSAALLCAVGTISAYVPARRASAIDPAIALRHS